MDTSRSDDWHPPIDLTLRGPHEVLDGMRWRCPVARSDELGWSVFRHEDILRVLHHPEMFSNAVSPHRAIPNGLDPPEHALYRLALERFFWDPASWSSSPCSGRLPLTSSGRWCRGAGSSAWMSLRSRTPSGASARSWAGHSRSQTR